MARPDLPRLLGAALLGCGALACAPTGADAPAREPVLGLPCEGCEAVFDGLPTTLSWTARLAPEDEPGEGLVLEGTVRDLSGSPAAGVIVYAYHTDAHGVYPIDPMAPSAAARRHGRLRGWARTDERGRYRFDTIRPAGYPDSPVAQHIHMHVIEPDCCTYYIDDVHFEDDERLGEAERRGLLVGRGGSGLVRPAKDQSGVWRARRDIRLGEGIPGHPGGRARQAPPGSSFEPTAPASLAAGEDFLVTEPEWSHDGGRLVFAGGVWPDLDIWVLELGGAAAAVFGGTATQSMPSWSPDGSRIVFASDREGSFNVYVGPSTGGRAVPLTTGRSCESTEPRWPPSGEWITYRSDCDGNREVYRVRPDGSGRERLTHHPEEDSEPAWSPDGRRLVFTSLRDGQPEVYVMAEDGSGLRRLTTTPGGHSRRPEWSPDGRQIAFGSNREGNEEIYVMQADGSDPENVSRHPAREYYSRWSPDGARLVFTSNRDRPKNAIYTTHLDGVLSDYSTERNQG